MNVAQRVKFDEILDGMVVGSPSHCRTEIIRLCESFGTRETGIVTVTYGFETRLASYQLLAQALLSNGLQPTP